MAVMAVPGFDVTCWRVYFTNIAFDHWITHAIVKGNNCVLKAKQKYPLKLSSRKLWVYISHPYPIPEKDYSRQKLCFTPVILGDTSLPEQLKNAFFISLSVVEKKKVSIICEVP